MTTVTVPTVRGENEINRLATAAMEATLEALVEAKLLDFAVADEFADHHVAILLDEHPLWARIRRVFGLKEGRQLVVVFKALRKDDGA